MKMEPNESDNEKNENGCTWMYMDEKRKWK
jgi:hypothetical protein